MNQDLAKYYSEISDLIAGKYKNAERVQLIRTILDKLFKDLTKEFGVSFSGLHSRMSYYFQKQSMPAVLVKDLNSLRQFCNQVVHGSREEVTINNEAYCIKILSDFLSIVSGVKVPTQTSNYYSKEKYFNPLISIKSTKTEIVPELEGVIISMTRGLSPDKFDNEFINLKLETNEGDEVSVRLTNASPDDFITDTIDNAWQYAELLVTDLKFNSETGVHYSSNKTLVVLEPSYLIDVKQISECYQFIRKGEWDINPSLYQAKKFEQPKMTEQILKGNLVGSILDEIASGSSFDFPSKADEFYKSNRTATFSLINQNGPGILDKINIEAEMQGANISNCLTKYKGYSVAIEPTFISLKYGLQGRLDALYESNANHNEKDVIELKSGKSQFRNPQHQTQTALYDLLLKSTYPERSGNSFILYSQKPKDALTLVNSDDNEFYFIARRAVLIRNKIVADEYKLKEGDLSPLDGVLFHTSLSEIENKYFRSFIKFISSEMFLAKERHREILLQASGENTNSKYLTNLRIDNITKDFQIDLNTNPNNELQFINIPDFKEGDFILLFPVEPDGSTNPLKHRILKGSIVEIKENYIKIILVNKQQDESYLKSYKLWAICQDFRESSIKSLYSQLNDFIQSDKEKKELFLTLERSPSFEPTAPINQPKLTKLQNSIIEKAVAAKDYYLIQGPPGTGKTRYILSEIASILSETKKIVIIAYTNQAVKEICNSLLERGLFFVQLGSTSISEYNINNIGNKLPMLDFVKNIKESKIFIATQQTLVANSSFINELNCEILIVDEASQLLEPQLVGIVSKFKKTILIGDEKQLPAISLQAEDKKNIDPDLKAVYLNSLCESLFYRLIINAKAKRWDCVGLLSEQGRMHEDIAFFSNKYYYNNKLQPLSDDQKQESQIFSRSSSNPLEKMLVNNRCLFLEADYDGKGFSNENEKRIIITLIKVIDEVCKRNNFRIVEKANSSTEVSIGIIAPFRKQIANIIKDMPFHLKEIILVDTIEKFQGSERSIIFYSTTVNTKAQLEKLQSLIDVDGVEVDRKLNVALTRAKDNLIITGTKSVLQKEKHYGNLIMELEKKNACFNLPI